MPNAPLVRALTGGGGAPFQAERLLLEARGLLVILFEDVEGIAMVVLHTDSAEDRTYRTRGSSLFPDHFSHIRGRNPESKHRAFVSFHRLNIYRLWDIDQRSRNLGHQFLHIIGSVCCLCHFAPQLGRHTCDLPGLRGYYRNAAEEKRIFRRVLNPEYGKGNFWEVSGPGERVTPP